MENERLIGLLAYLSALTKLANSEVSYLCTKEIGECIGWIRKELSGDAVKQTIIDAYRDTYISELKRISDGYTPMNINVDLYDAYTEGLGVKTLWVDRGCGASTSAVALSNVVPKTIYVVESEQLADYYRVDLDAKNVVTLNKIRSGSDLIRNNDVFIFDDVIDRSVLVGPLQAVFGRDKRIIKIRSSDYAD